MSLDQFFDYQLSPSRTLIVLLAVAALASFDLSQRFRHHRRTHYIFAAVLGSILGLGLIKLAGYALSPAGGSNPYVITVGLLLLWLGWKAVFGPWEAPTKATVVGTFLFWLLFNFFSKEAASERPAHLFAAFIALIPAVIWCKLFLKYHRERVSTVLLMFFAGMLSTVPVLAYDAMVRSGVAIDLLLLRITPESFNRSSQTFVQGQLGTLEGVQTTLAISFVTFLCVGIMEEVSKQWMVRRNGVPLFSSIDDAMQLSIMVAIGFAFAENVINPTYFLGFVRQHLLAGSPDVVGFLSNVTGRAVLTSMVHIVSTGVMGYFIGLALFADPYLKDAEKRGHHHRLLHGLSVLIRVPVKSIYRKEMMIVGLLAAIVLHGLFNFLVTLPDLLPGNPSTLGEATGMTVPVLRSLPILLFPALFYVLGGFWLLTGLFLRAENAVERGRLVPVETLVPVTAAD